jgi:hypothetical protein
MLHTLIDTLIHTTTTTAQYLEFILAYTSVTGPGEICIYTKDHEEPLDGPPKDVWHMYEHTPVHTTFELEAEFRTHLDRL